jgi:hypothetical protein
MKEFALFFGVMILWIVLNRWILPWFGVPTCMSGGCATRKPSACCTESARASDAQPLSTKGEEK